MPAIPSGRYWHPRACRGMPFGKLRTPARVTAPDLGVTGAVNSHESAMRWVGHMRNRIECEKN
jgi:hypothetical protein